MGDKLIINWETFGKHNGVGRRIARVKNKRGGVGLANVQEAKMLSHRAFLLKEEAEVLSEWSGKQWTETSPDQKETGVYGKYTMTIEGQGRFFTDHLVGEAVPYVAPDVDAPVNRGFSPIASFRRVSADTPDAAKDAQEVGERVAPEEVSSGIYEENDSVEEIAETVTPDMVPEGGLVDAEGTEVDNTPLYDANADVGEDETGPEKE